MKKETINPKEHWNESFYAHNLKEKDFSGHYFYRCVFTNSIADKTTNFRAAFFENCNLSYMDAVGSIWERSIRNYCNLIHADLSDTNQKMSKVYWCDLKGVDFTRADLRGIETDFSRFQYVKMIDSKFGGWSREIIAEIIRQSTTDLRIKQVAAWIKDESQLCWEQFLLLFDSPGIKDIQEKILKILRSSGFGYLIDSGGRLCLTSASQKE